MENEEKTMSGEESLRIITEMINKTKISICQGSFHLLLWGWLVFFCSLSEYLLRRFTQFEHPYYVWLLVIPGVFVSLFYGFIKGRKQPYSTYATYIYVWTWMAFLFSAVILYVLMLEHMNGFSAFILTIAAIPTFISGIILKFKPLIIGAFSFWLFALINHFAGTDIAPLAVPAAMLTGYLIPGYLLKRKNHGTV